MFVELNDEFVEPVLTADEFPSKFGAVCSKVETETETFVLEPTPANRAISVSLVKVVPSFL